MNNFYVKLSDNEKLRELQSELLQRTAFENGFVWGDGRKIIQYYNYQFLYFNSTRYGRKEIYKNNEGGTIGDIYKPFSLEQALEYLMNSDKSNIYNKRKFIINGTSPSEESKKVKWTDVPKDIIKSVYEKWRKIKSIYKSPTGNFWFENPCDLCKWIKVKPDDNCDICPAYPEWCQERYLASSLGGSDPDHWSENVDRFLRMLEELDPELKPKELGYKEEIEEIFDRLTNQMCYHSRSYVSCSQCQYYTCATSESRRKLMEMIDNSACLRGIVRKIFEMILKQGVK